MAYHHQDNQFGPPAASPYAPMHPSMHPDSGYRNRPADERLYDQNAYQLDDSPRPSSRQRQGVDPTGTYSPYRDMNSPSPDLHPGMPHPPSSRGAHSQPADYSAPRSRSRNQDPFHPERDDHRSHGPNTVAAGAGIGAGVGAAAALSNAYDSHNAYTPPAGNLAKYAQLNQSHPSDYPNATADAYGSYNSPYHAGRSQGQSSHASYNSMDPLPPNAQSPAMAPSAYSAYGDGRSPSPNRPLPTHPYQTPYDAHSISRNNLNGLEYIDPNAVADDGDDGLGLASTPKRRSVISLGGRAGRSNPQVNLAAGAGAAAGIGAAAAGAAALAAHDVHNRGGGDDSSRDGFSAEKANAFQPFVPEKPKGSKWKKLIFIIIGLVVLGAIAGGVVGGIMAKNKQDNAQNGGSSGASNGPVDTSSDFSVNSKEVKALLNNKNLHKVFMGMAYTPLNAQYPDCLTNKPIQNNVTLDMAVMSQLTNVIRLYGTDCNQTEMALHAIDRLKLTDMKVWVGVWLGNNATTNTRQVEQLWTILDTYGTKYIKGVVVGNEVLFRKDLSITQLGDTIASVKSNLSSKYPNDNLPIASSDLGDNWTADLAAKVDVVMSNVHPFFGGVAVDQAAGWTWSFWQSHDVALTKGLTGKSHVISEVGWPSAGGNDCGAGTCTDSTSGAVAGINQMNQFMDSWVCQAMSNKTDYLWFEGFDEPWKIQYNTPGRSWEDKWGLFDVNRNLKSGLKIPSCNGGTIPAQ